MVEVGSQAGMVHDPLHQGVGLATVLDGNRAVDTAERIGAEYRAIGRQEKAKKEAELAGAYDTMLKMNPERWMKHEAVILPQMNEWVDQGAAMMQKGVNPWKSVSPEAIAFRKKAMDIQSLANTSKQMQDTWEKNRAKLASSEPGKYDDTVIKANADFFNQDPRAVRDSGAIPPPLMQKKPFLNLQDTISKGMGDINSKLNGQPIPPGDRWKISREFLTNPAIADDLNESAASALAQMTPADANSVQKRARDLGKSPQEVIVFDFVNRYADKQKPFSFQEWIDEGVKQVGVPYKEWRGADSFSKKVDPAEFNRIAKERAAVMLTDPEALREYENELPRDPSWNDGDYKLRATNHLASKLKNLVATQEEAGVTQQGQGKKDLEVSRKKWLENMESLDTDKNKEAMGYLMSAPGILPGMTVQNAAIYEDEPGKRELKLYVAGNLEYKDVKRTMEQAGIPVEENQLESRQTNTIITVPITTQTENALMRLHDHAYEDTKLPYGGTYNEPKPNLKSLINPGKTPETPPAPSAKKNRF